MFFRHARAVRRPLAIFAGVMLLSGCDEESPLENDRDREIQEVVEQLKAVTQRYHDIDNAIADGFTFVHGCEIRPGEEPAGMVYAHPDRMGDGEILPQLPDGLLYEPNPNGKPALVGVEMVMPYPLWTEDAPPTFLGETFEREDEFGVFGLHIWVWRDNPEGLFADGNPNVSCADE